MSKPKRKPSKAKPKSTPKVTAQVSAVAVDIWPIFTSIRQCSGATGLPHAWLKDLKAKGCPAFTPSKIYFSGLMPEIGKLITGWISGGQENQPELKLAPGTEGHRSKKDEWDWKMKKLKFDQAAKLVKPVEEIRTGIQAAMSELFGALDRMLGSEMPPAIVGLREMAIREIVMKYLEELKGTMRARYQELMKQENEKEHQK